MQSSAVVISSHEKRRSKEVAFVRNTGWTEREGGHVNHRKASRPDQRIISNLWRFIAETS